MRWRRRVEAGWLRSISQREQRGGDELEHRTGFQPLLQVILKRSGDGFVSEGSICPIRLQARIGREREAVLREEVEGIHGSHEVTAKVGPRSQVRFDGLDRWLEAALRVEQCGVERHEEREIRGRALVNPSRPMVCRPVPLHGVDASVSEGACKIEPRPEPRHDGGVRL
jgi:hypothetical protein